MFRTIGMSAIVGIAFLMVAAAMLLSVVLGTLTLWECITGGPVVSEFALGPIRQTWSCGVAP